MNPNFLSFKVSSAPHYELTVHEYDKAESTLGNSLKYHDSMGFTTSDRDNDKHTTNCARIYRGAWWFNNCLHSNLNGMNYDYKQDNYRGIVWYHGGERGRGFRTWKEAVMKIRRRQDLD